MGALNSDHHTLCLTIYYQYNQLIVGILAVSQVSHCLRNSVRFASPTGRPSSLSWLRILTLLPHLECVVTEYIVDCA
jgi:hypothetical protein